MIHDDLSAIELRKLARQRPDRAAAARMMAIANALEGMPRAEAARLAGMERQALRDAVVRYNAAGLDGLHDRPRPGAKSKLTDKQREQLRQIVLDGPDVEKTGLSAWTLAELCGEVKRRWSVDYHAGHMPKLMRKLVCRGRRPARRIPGPISRAGCLGKRELTDQHGSVPSYAETGSAVGPAINRPASTWLTPSKGDVLMSRSGGLADCNFHLGRQRRIPQDLNAGNR